jgi:hypothetical protein
VRIFFQAALEDYLDVGFSHGLAQLPVHDGARAAVEQRTEVEEGPRDVDIGDIDVPVFMGASGCTKPAPLNEGFGFQQSRSPAPLSTR